MGYTHYFHTYDKKRFRTTKESRDRVLPFLRDIASRYEDILTGDGSGETRIPVVLNDKEIHLNGIGDDSHEDFWFTLRSFPHDFTFCKTARKPYDAPVSEMLIVLKHFFAEKLFVDSDGFAGSDYPPENRYVDDEWIEAAGQVKARYGITTKLFTWNQAVRIVNGKPEPLRRNLIRPNAANHCVPTAWNETVTTDRACCLEYKRKRDNYGKNL